ncbi:FAST kinase domain-containing protein 4 [Anthophora quadrimaculata]
MLQFNTTFYTITSRCTSRLLWRIHLSFSTNSTITATKPVNTVKSNHQKQATALNISINHNQHVEFNELKKNICTNFKMEPALFTTIQNAQNVNDLLQVINTSALNQNAIAEAKKAIVTWINVNDKLTSNSKAKSLVSDATKVQGIDFTKTEDAIIDLKRYRDLSTAEMIKEITNLTTTKNRNTHLLNYFFQNILEHNIVLKLGQCSSLLYSMSILNYSDERLLNKICCDLINIGRIHITMLTSMLRSMASIRYKNKMFLKYVCDNIIKSSSANVKRNKEIVSVLLSLATLGYHSEAVDKIIEIYKKKWIFTNIENTDRLNLVWSLIIFKKAEISDVASVLNKTFVLKLMAYDLKITLSHQLKLLNINGYAQYALKNYKGPFLDHSIIPCVTNKRSKQKELNITILQETLKNMLPSLSHFKMNVNTNMGFLLDAEFFVDSNFHIVNIDTDKNKKLTKIGILLVDYYETCLGEQAYLGLIKLYKYLLTCNNYTVIYVPYQHFGLEDKLEKHIAYLRRQLGKAFNKTI